MGGNTRPEGSEEIVSLVDSSSVVDLGGGESPKRLSDTVPLAESSLATIIKGLDLNGDNCVPYPTEGEAKAMGIGQRALYKERITRAVLSAGWGPNGYSIEELGHLLHYKMEGIGDKSEGRYSPTLLATMRGVMGERLSASIALADSLTVCGAEHRLSTLASVDLTYTGYGKLPKKDLLYNIISQFEKNPDDSDKIHAIKVEAMIDRWDAITVVPDALLEDAHKEIAGVIEVKSWTVDEVNAAIRDFKNDRTGYLKNLLDNMPKEFRYLRYLSDPLRKDKPDHSLVFVLRFPNDIPEDQLLEIREILAENGPTEKIVIQKLPFTVEEINERARELAHLIAKRVTDRRAQQKIYARAIAAESAAQKTSSRSENVFEPDDDEDEIGKKKPPYEPQPADVLSKDQCKLLAEL